MASLHAGDMAHCDNDAHGKAEGDQRGRAAKAIVAVKLAEMLSGLRGSIRHRACTRSELRIEGRSAEAAKSSRQTIAKPRVEESQHRTLKRASTTCDRSSSQDCRGNGIEQVRWLSAGVNRFGTMSEMTL
ncbi:MAG: hypothetical protein CEE40_03405 [Chloroflexi bacterium B3_Chlor]|nr:MAG: hypothetical protein CEE40_03405 [Chloroflexi bacterium B3_Chlor]